MRPATGGDETNERPVITGVTVKDCVAVAIPSASRVTVYVPAASVDGTVTTMEVALQLSMLADVPLKLTVLFPWSEGKLAPDEGVSVSVAPGTPDVTDSVKAGVVTTTILVLAVADV
jgi:hypothetical protein